jgi:predicted Zn-dependent protease
MGHPQDPKDLMMRRGHADFDQECLAAELAERVRTGSATDNDILELALLSLEPLHDIETAASLLEGLVNRSPHDPLPKIWLAFIYIYEIMTPTALENAIALCDELSVIAESSIHAAALLLKATALRDSGSNDVRTILEESVRVRTDWISNRQLLAQVYLEHGNMSAAKRELGEALHNVASESPKTSAYQDFLFEELITLRLSDGVAERLALRIRSLPN